MGKVKKTEKVQEILKSIQKQGSIANEEPKAVEDKVAQKSQKAKEKAGAPDVPRGKPKSGRVWKSPKKRFSTVKKSKGAHTSFAEKEALRQQLNQVKQVKKETLEQQRLEKERQKERRRENLKRAEVNRLKSEIVQVISNSSKIKRMKKKQLRFIEKRDTTKVEK